MRLGGITYDKEKYEMCDIVKKISLAEDNNRSGASRFSSMNQEVERTPKDGAEGCRNPTFFRVSLKAHHAFFSLSYLPFSTRGL